MSDMTVKRKKTTPGFPRQPEKDETVPQANNTTPDRSKTLVYQGAPSTQVGIRMLVPLHKRYASLVRACAEEDFKTSATEIIQALLHEGPQTTKEIKETVIRWRQTQLTT